MSTWQVLNLPTIMLGMSIKNTPFMLNYGQHPLTPMYRGISRDRVPAARAFVGAMSEMLAVAKEHLKAAQQRQKAHADKKRREVSYEDW